MMMIKRFFIHWTNFWFQPQPPQRLAVSRIIFYLLFFIFLKDTPALPTIDPAFPLEPEWHPLGFFRVLHIPPLNFSKGVFLWLKLFWEIAIIFSALGLFTRFSTKVVFFLGFYLVAAQYNYGSLEHSAQLPMVIAGILAFSKCGDAFSLDCFYKRRNLGPDHSKINQNSSEYFWPVRLSQTYIMIIYFQAAWQKLRYGGIDWALSDNFRIMLLTRSNLTDLGYFITNHPTLCQSIALIILVFQLFSITAVFSKRLAIVIVPFLFFFHFATALIMGGGAIFLTYNIAYVFWVPWDQFVQRYLKARGVFPLLFRI